MNLAILMTNTDESDFAQAHPKDGEKFTSLIRLVRPDWGLSSYSVKDGVFPDDITDFDGIMITGSPASVLDGHKWIDELLETIRIAYAANVPMFGACFGHQAIALALGGSVEKSDSGWAFGVIEMAVENAPDWYDDPSQLFQYGAHIDHVTKLPTGAKILFSSDHCGIAGFAMGDRVYTTQNHPEMTSEFAAALVDEYAPELGPEITEKAQSSLERSVQMEPFAESIARFFEMAVDS